VCSSDLCVFDNCISNSAGGAIQLYTDTLNGSFLSLTRCFFHSCTANMHGGAVYALVARHAIVDSCFNWCSSRDRQAGLFRGESSVPHVINLTLIAFCGRGTNDRTTFSTSSAIMIVVDMNSTCNNVAQWAAGHYLETNRMAYMKFTTFSDNIGVNILNYQLRNQESSLEYVKLVNNSAALSWKTLIYTSAGIAMGHFYFVQNSKPFVVADPLVQNVFFIDCVFDVPFENKLFSCTFNHTQCEFDIENPVLPAWTTLRSDICVDRFAVKTADEVSDTLIWWILGIAVCVAGGYILFFGGPRGKNDEERLPFKRARRFAD
jgi:hypothetical protein